MCPVSSTCHNTAEVPYQQCCDASTLVHAVSGTVSISVTFASLTGIPEDLLVGQLDALAPQSARDMLGMLVAARLLRLQTVPAPRNGPPPIFGAAGHVKPPAPVRTVVGHHGLGRASLSCAASSGPRPM